MNTEGSSNSKLIQVLQAVSVREALNDGGGTNQALACRGAAPLGCVGSSSEGKFKGYITC